MSKTSTMTTPSGMTKSTRTTKTTTKSSM
jgi:hypothetical protein